MQTILGVIGGSGLYDLPALKECTWRQIGSPWGEPSDEVLFATFEGLPVRFLPRHGRGHRLGPGEINYRANIDVLKRAGVTDLISVSACGSLREKLAPGAFILVDQFIDRTVARPASFFGPGCVAHVAMADPVSPLVVDLIATAAKLEAIEVINGGTYIAIEGPQFSTRAESRLFQSWGADVVGMTNMPEARLAREAELCYATLGMVTDYDGWRPGEVSVPDILRVMHDNVAKAQRLLARIMMMAPRERTPCPIGSDCVLDTAIVTPPDARDRALVAKLDAVAGRVLGNG